MRNEFIGNIESVRAVEDCIRATKKYTEGIGTMRLKHPIQGEDIPSRVFNKYYEVYPDLKSVSWDMPAGQAIEWLSGGTPCYDIVFHYDYRSNYASVHIKDGDDAVEKLSAKITGLSQALRAVRNGVK